MVQKINNKKRGRAARCFHNYGDVCLKPQPPHSIKTPTPPRHSSFNKHFLFKLASCHLSILSLTPCKFSHYHPSLHFSILSLSFLYHYCSVLCCCSYPSSNGANPDTNAYPLVQWDGHT